jgi:SAM-dependent methyltransferase
LTLAELLRCPACRAALEARDAGFTCSGCAREYPVVDGVPVLIDETQSIFRPEDYLDGAPAAASAGETVLRRIDRLLPPLTQNTLAAANYAQLAELLVETVGDRRPRVLVVGGRVVGAGMDDFVARDFEFVETDVDFGPRTKVICDGQQLPFADGVFDAVVAQAVLGAIADPYRAVEEMHRVLGPAGLVYAEDGFIQQVWGGRYDFTRWTHTGHRRLFRRFEELASGPVLGAGTALAWSWQFFLLSLATGKPARLVLRAVARLTGFWLRHLDRPLDRPGVYDAASGFYFLGRRSESVRSDRELVRSYAGAVGASSSG